MIPFAMLTSVLSGARPRLHFQETPPVDAELLSGDVAGRVRREEHDCFADVLGLDVGNRHGLNDREHEFGVLAGGVLQGGPERAIHRRAWERSGTASCPVE